MVFIWEAKRTRGGVVGNEPRKQSQSVKGLPPRLLWFILPNNKCFNVVQSTNYKVQKSPPQAIALFYRLVEYHADIQKSSKLALKIWKVTHRDNK